MPASSPKRLAEVGRSLCVSCWIDSLMQHKAVIVHKRGGLRLIAARIALLSAD